MVAGVYLHIPFCKSRCSYCDFATDVYRESDAVERYVKALCREIESFVHRGVLTDTIYFGGGTPSLLNPQQFAKVISVISSVFEIDKDPEITMEMNPATVTPESLSAYRTLGVNRASFGVQTFNDRDLKLLARGHNANDARDTFQILRAAGYENISFDLIAGLPGQSIDDWSRNLDEALSMDPEHLSLYLLEIHEGTPLAEQVRSGRRPVPDEVLAARMYELMVDRVEAAGYRQYEISNFAKPGFNSCHNSKYWRMEPVYGFGVSAHSFNGAERYANERDTAKYVELIESRETAEVYREAVDAASESVFLGLRLNEGVAVDEYQDRFGVDLSETTQEGQNNGLLEIENGRLKLTSRGRLFSNEVFADFV